MEPPALSLLSLREPSIAADPYPFYERVRAAGVAVRDPLGVWLVGRHAEAAAAFQDPRLSSDRLDQVRALRPDREHPEVAGLFETLKRQMLFLDPPRHTRLRGLVARAFTPRRIEALRAAIAGIVEGLLAPGLRAGRLEVMADVAVPLPMTVICDALGVPAADRAQVKAWSEDYAVFLGGTLALPHERMIELARSLAAFTAYYRHLLAARRADPCGDLASALGQAADAEGASEDELCATCVLLTAAGHETTTNLIGNGLLALLRHPESFAALRADPARLPAAIEELLRYDSPVQITVRRARERLELGGTAIDADQVIYFIVGAANRDPARFERPDALELLRENNRHLSFGSGPHHCVGAYLARVEAQELFGAILRTTRGVRLAGEAPRFRINPALRGLEHLHVEVDAA